MASPDEENEGLEYMYFFSRFLSFPPFEKKNRAPLGEKKQKGFYPPPKKKEIRCLAHPALEPGILYRQRWSRLLRR
jgi:hypothetical protein